jgi:mannose-6-phosphate isomerase-like protein (cupin superfamily)
MKTKGKPAKSPIAKKKTAAAKATPAKKAKRTRGKAAALQNRAAGRAKAPAKRQPAKGPRFAQGTFHASHARDAVWDEGLREYFAYRDLGMVERTGGRVRAHVIRPSKPCDKVGDLHFHALDFQMVYVLKGWARVHFDGIGEVRFEEGSCMYQEPGIRHRVLEYSDDYTVIEITIPADFDTVSVAP